MCEHCPDEALDEVTQARLDKAIALQEENAHRLERAEERMARFAALLFPPVQPHLREVRGDDA
jgi:ribonucleotide reductase alpha subunit